MEAFQVRAGRVSVEVGLDGAMTIGVVGAPAMRIGSATLGLSGASGRLTRKSVRVTRGARGAVVVEEEFEPGPIRVVRIVDASGEAVTIESRLANVSDRPFTLGEVWLLEAAGGLSLGARPRAVRVYEQGGYWARVRGLDEMGPTSQASGEQDGSQRAMSSESQYVWAAYDGQVRAALLAGFETGERWTGHIRTSSAGGAAPCGWAMGFGGGLTTIPPGAATTLEAICLMAGDDPWALLCAYGDRVRERHGVKPIEPPVSWCSWYPYRLGVTDDRAMATARIAASRLRPLGLKVIELDLGWEKQWLPSAFDENDQFPRGLRKLADDLERLGFVLGAWKAPFTISAHDPVAASHPEWLLRGEGDAGPRPTGQWFWEPHGETYALDLTHPGALAWLRERMRSLAERGVRYFKPDFIGGVTGGALTGRHDRERAAGGGAEAIRAGMRVIVEELRSRDSHALVLNCGGPDIPGAGAFPLLYTCNDTGNTGFVGWRHLEDDYGRNVAGHLWKNRRWGVLQPSCLVVGPPGGIEEARLRATATFLTGGQVDIGDDLTCLPEDRWQVLLATLPPLGRSATPLDLFEPIAASSVAYDAMAAGRGGDMEASAGGGASRVWVLPVRTEWDDWTLVGIFNYDTNDDVEYGKASITRFVLPVSRLGIGSGSDMTAFEFWSGQFAGRSPFVVPNPKGYRHPGDMQRLIRGLDAANWEVAFFGPGVRLLSLRRARPHPWPVGTSFHQSCGAELAGVVWSGDALKGRLERPAGEAGRLVVASDRGMPREARVAGRRARVHEGASGSVVLPIVAASDRTAWEMRW
jgi:hypothetical protein